MPAPVIYVHELSQPARSVNWFAHYAKLDVERKFLDLNAKEQKAPEYVAKFPSGQVPALEHDGLFLEESAAILQYLAHGSPILPAGRRERAEHDQWIARHLTTARKLTSEVIFPFFFAPDDKKKELVAAGMEKVQPVLKVYNDRLSKVDYVTGKLSLADFLLVPELDQMVILAEPLGRNILEPYPALGAYLERMAQVDGYADNRALAIGLLTKLRAAREAAAAAGK